MPRPHARKPRNAGRKRRKGALVPALVLTSMAGAACIAAYAILSRGPSTTDFEDDLGLPAPDVAQIGRGGSAEIILKDKEDPTRVVAIVSYDSQTPIGQGRYDTVNPRAWVFLEDGRYLHVRADQGRFYAPDEQRPQTGVMSGDVLVRLFDAAPQRPADDAVAPVTIRVASASFDTEYGSIRSDDRVQITTPEADISLNGLRLVINQVQERIELLEVRDGGRIVYTPQASAGAGATEASAGAGAPRPRAAQASIITAGLRQPGEPGAAVPGSAPQPGGTPAPGRAPRRRADDPVYYFAQFNRGVRITQGEVSVSGDLLEVHARVVDNAIADGPLPAASAGRTTAGPGMAAIVRTALGTTPGDDATSGWYANHQPATVEAGRPAASVPLGHGDGPTQAPGPASSAFEPPVRVLPTPEAVSDVPVTLDWAGPLTLRPVGDEPAELRREHLAARLTGGEGGGVALADVGSGATGACARLEYGFTSESVVLAGVGESGVRLSAGSGDIHAFGSGPAGSDSAVASATPGVDVGSGDAGVSAAPATDTPNAGTLRAGRAEYAVATGVGRVPGPGTLEGEGFQRIAWTRQMDFLLRAEGRRVLAAPEELIFQGDVHGEDEAASFDAGFARAAFIPAPREAGSDAGPARSILSSIFLDEAVTLRGPEDERVAAASIRVDFEPPGQARHDQGGPTPSRFEADGGVTASRPGERVAAERVVATLEPDAHGRAQVQSLAAQGGVEFRSRPEALEITGEQMDADVPDLRLRVRGTPEELARVARGSTSIAGVDVRLAGRPRGARVRGVGSFSHTAQPESGRARPSSSPFGTADRAEASVEFDASWTQLMTFNDATGRLRCVGDVVAIMAEGPTRVDRLTAWTVEAAIDPAGGRDRAGPAAATPANTSDPAARRPFIFDPNSPRPEPPVPGRGAPDQADDPGPGDSQPEGADFDDPAARDRHLRTLTAIGSIADSPDGERAEIESRRYGPPAPDGSRALTQLLYLAGDRILVDNAAGVLDVPSAGKLLIVDRRVEGQERPAEGSPFGGATARGDALFGWQGSLHAEREAGVLTMTDRVVMTHRRAGDGALTELEAPVLTARASGGAGDGADGAGRLRSVHAEGGVWVRSGDQEVTAGVVDYDADTGVLTAHTPGGTVRFMHGAGVSTAEAIRWDMNAGRFEMVPAGSLVAPR